MHYGTIEPFSVANAAAACTHCAETLPESGLETKTKAEAKCLEVQQIALCASKNAQIYCKMVNYTTKATAGY